MILGFTGTREGCSFKQKDYIRYFLRQERPTQAHHGGCIGADTEFHHLVTQYNNGVRPQDRCRIVVHPPTNLKYATPVDELIAMTQGYPLDILPPRGYHERDRDIVKASDHMLAVSLAGDTLGTMGSGTWWTVRCAVALRKPVTVIYPSGKVVSY